MWMHPKSPCSAQKHDENMHIDSEIDSMQSQCCGMVWYREAQQWCSNQGICEITVL